MRRGLLIGVCMAAPFAANALEYQSNRSLLYTDAPFNVAEAAGISVLTELGAVQGNPDGTFAPNRTLNRAEFLKIVLSSHPQIRVSLSDTEACFPDVKTGDWFSRYVCLAKKRGIVKGYPDGLFHPERSVNYAEALAMLGRLYGYTAWAAPDAPWYQIYVQAAINHRTILPVSLPYDRELTRGQMARLAAASRAEHEGELELYRQAEQGRYVRAEVPEGASSSAPQEAGQQASVPEEAERMPDLPSRSRFIVLGERSEPIADGTFYPLGGDAALRIVVVELENEVESLDALYLIDSNGQEIAELKIDLFDQEDETWRADLDPASPYVLPGNEGAVLALEARMQYPPTGGFSRELLKVRRFLLSVEPVDGGESRQLVPSNAHFPWQQPALGRLEEVRNVLAETGALAAGQDRLLAAFSADGTALSGSAPAVEHLSFRVRASSGVLVTNWELASPTSSLKHPCSREGTDIVNCLGIPAELSAIGSEPRVFRILGDVSLGGDRGSLQLVLENAGTIGELGSLRWTDGTGHYTWVEIAEPLLEGTVWTR